MEGEVTIGTEGVGGRVFPGLEARAIEQIVKLGRRRGRRTTPWHNEYFKLS